MSLNVSETRALVGTRVRVRVQPTTDEVGWYVGILRGVPSEASVWLTVDEQGHEQKLDYVTRVEPGLIECQRCGKPRSFIEDGLCVDCRRKAAQRRSTQHVSRCQSCGQAGAFRNPRDPQGRYLCTRCHAQTGIPLTAVSAGDASRLRADCQTADVNDERHLWKGVRGSRWACTRCGAQRYSMPRRVTDITSL